MARHTSAVLAFSFAWGAAVWLASPAAAVGPYMFASVGARQVTDQDMNDFFAWGGQPQEQFVPTFLGEAYLTAGYRFSDPFALEVAGGAQQGREQSNLYPFGAVDLQVPTGALTQLSIAPVFCFDTFESVDSYWLNQVGLRLEYAQVSGTETLQTASGVGTLGFNGAAVGGGLFYRLINLWAPARMSVGLEAGYDFLRFNTLQAGNPSGAFVGQTGRELQNLNGVAAYLDNSGPYLRLVIGWAKDSDDSLRTAAPAGRASADGGLLGRARELHREGDNLGALKAYRAYLGLHPDDPAAWRELAALYRFYRQEGFARQCEARARRLKAK